MKLKIIFSIILAAFFNSAYASSSHNVFDNYLVTWDPATVTSRDKFYEYLPSQADSLLKLWKENKVENVYLNPSKDGYKGEYIPLVMFVIKAKSEDEAHKILDQMPYVEHNVIEYKLQPMGLFWLGTYDASVM